METPWTHSCLQCSYESFGLLLVNKTGAFLSFLYLYTRNINFIINDHKVTTVNWFIYSSIRLPYLFYPHLDHTRDLHKSRAAACTYTMSQVVNSSRTNSMFCSEQPFELFHRKSMQSGFGGRTYLFSDILLILANSASTERSVFYC